MRAWSIEGGFGLEQLQEVELPAPAPGLGEVLVRTRCVSLNYRDYLVVSGRYNPRQALPLVPCSDAVGEVIALGDGVKRVKLGDRVAGCFAQRWIAGPITRDILRSTLGSPRQGVACDQLLLSAEGVVPVPEHLSDAEASTLPCAALTAWHALFGERPVRAGQTVLVLGTGGVSTWALQLAVAAGCRVVLTSSSEAKLERALALGASDGIHYGRTPEWGRELRRRIGGVDHVIEVGGAGTLARSLSACRPGGTISLIGVLAGDARTPDLTPALMQNIRIQGIFVGSRQMFEAMNRAVELHRIRPRIDRVFSREELPAALAYLASGAHQGKIVLRWSEG